MMRDDVHRANRDRLTLLRVALYDADPVTLPAVLDALFVPDCPIHLTHPFETLDGPGALYERALLPLLAAFPDLERRDFIVMAGHANGADWVGCGGFYTGRLERPWLDIPPTGHVAALRYHEFFRFEGDRIVEMQALWDIPHLMMQVGVWPMAPSLAREWLVPAPATSDGVRSGPRDEARSAASVGLVREMLAALKRSPEGVEAMALDRYWHPRMMWYGPGGIGTTRRISGFRAHHQIPFLRAMPDRAAFVGDGYLFGDGDYVGFTAWPGMTMTLTGDGWLGIPPTGQRLTMRSLDFWRCENGLIRENWVLVDLLDVYNQLGVDVLGRMRELTAGRSG